MGIRYQALGPLLAGEGSRAFLGLEISDHGAARPVVLVWVPDEANHDPDLLAQLHRETKHAASLEHPNIIRVYGLARLNESAARVVEFADGESLRRVLEVARRLPLALSAKVVADAAMGVHYAHEAGNDDGSPLIHGDLRPETLLVSFAGACKVSGYGALGFAPRELGGKRVVGRRQHCAPEQVLGGREAFTRQTDVYLLGLMFYECLTGAIPFSSEPDFDQAVLTRPFPAIALPEVPQAIEAVVAKATAKRAQERYPTALAFRQAIEEAMGALPSNEDLSRSLQKLFPEGDERRVARRHAIDAGVADLARSQWEEQGSGPPPPPRPERKEARAAPPLPRVREPQPAPRQGSSLFPVLVGAGLLVAAVAVAFLATRETPRPVPVPEPAPPLEAKAPPIPPPLTVVEDAGAMAQEQPDASVPSLAAVEPKPPEPPPEPCSLELLVEPEVELSIDGQPVGRSPYAGPLDAGRHLVKLSDSTRGISTSRVVVVKGSGKTTERIYLAKGYVIVSAPEGAQVFIDGRKVGTAPLRGELEVYEGNHRILVTVGKAKWQQPFSLRANERMSFDVETE